MANGRSGKPKLDKDLLLYETVLHVHKEIYGRMNNAFEEYRGWLNEVVEEAKKEFSKPEAALLPKTPSAKRKGRKKKISRTAKRKLSLASDDDVTPAKQQERSSRHQNTTDAASPMEEQQAIRVPSTPDTVIKPQPVGTPDTVIRPDRPVTTPPSVATPTIVATPAPVKQSDAGKKKGPRASKRKLPVELDDGVPPAKLECSRNEETHEPVYEKEVRSTRTKTRQQATESKESRSYLRSSEDEVPPTVSSSTDNANEETNEVAEVMEVRSTRTKTRQQATESKELGSSLRSSRRSSTVTGEVQSENEIPANSDSTDRTEELHEAVGAVVKEVRSTRTKTRQQALGTCHQPIVITNEDETNTVSSSTGGMNEEPNEVVEVMEVRTTRTKTRQQATESKESRSSLRSSQRHSPVTGENKTPTNTSSADSSSDDEAASTCPPNKIVRPHPKSFLLDLQKFSASKPPMNLNLGLVRSFITRNSPIRRPTMMELQEKRKKEMLNKSRANEERLRRQDEEQRKKIEENRKKREERMKRAQEIREQRKQRDYENRQLMEKKMEQHKQATDRLKEVRQREEREKQRLRNQKLEEAEERRKQEEEQRQKKLQEQELQEKKRKELLDKARANEERLRRQEEEQRKNQKLEEAEERRKQEEEQRQKKLQEQRLKQAELERQKEQQRRQEEELRKLANKHNNQLHSQQQSGHHGNQAAKVNPTACTSKTNLNRTHSLSESTVEQPTRSDSYEMTPKKKFAKSTKENYNIFDLNSGDETDEEDDPRKTVPDWAKGSQLTTQLIKNHLHPPDLDALFDHIQPPDLCELFKTQKKRFFKRTSSAHWDTPVLGFESVNRVIV